MKIQEKDFFHGAALTQITEHESFKALNKADEKYGHYLINTDKRLLVKHASKLTSQDQWHFGFAKDDLQVLKNDISSAAATFAILVCGKETICLLDESDIKNIIDLDADNWYINVSTPKGKSMRISAKSGKKLTRTISHNRFPSEIFE